MAEGDTGINALIGAVATVLLSGFVPFAPALGGGIAGYLQGGSRNDGIRVGVVSGAIALVPAILLGFLFFGLFTTIFVGGAMGGMGGMPLGIPAFGGVFFLFAAVFGAVYLVGLSAVGGWLGNYVKYDTDIDI
jgi:Ca2+-binding RTX toxin-like protein